MHPRIGLWRPPPPKLLHWRQQQQSCPEPQPSPIFSLPSPPLAPKSDGVNTDLGEDAVVCDGVVEAGPEAAHLSALHDGRDKGEGGAKQQMRGGQYTPYD